MFQMISVKRLFVIVLVTAAIIGGIWWRDAQKKSPGDPNRFAAAVEFCAPDLQVQIPGGSGQIVDHPVDPASLTDSVKALSVTDSVKIQRVGKTVILYTNDPLVSHWLILHGKPFQKATLQANLTMYKGNHLSTQREVMLNKDGDAQVRILLNYLQSPSPSFRIKLWTDRS